VNSGVKQACAVDRNPGKHGESPKEAA